MADARIENKAYVTNYDPTRPSHRAFFLAVLDTLAKHDPATLQDGGALRKLWLVDAMANAPAHNLFDSLRPLLDIIAQGEGSYTSVNKGRAGDTPGGYPGLDRLTIGQVQALQKGELFAVGRYQFIPETLGIALKDAGMKSSDMFSMETQDWLAVCLLLGSKRPALRDYLKGQSVSLDTAQTELAKEWASIPMPDGRGFYDGDRAGNRASAKVAEVRQALEKARAALGGKSLPQLKMSAQQQPANPSPSPNTKPRKIPPYLLLTRTKKVNGDGLELLRLQRLKDGIPMDQMLVVSGAPKRQSFRRGADSKSGSLEPIPEGLWTIDNIAWKNGKDNYIGSWGEGLGPASVPLKYKEPGITQRANIEIHYDANHGYSPGTAGCIGLRSIEDLKKLVSWLRLDDARLLFVDYGLGSCPAMV